MSSAPMPTWMKFLIVIVGLLCVLGVLGGVAVWWAMAKIENSFTAMEEELPQIAEEATVFAASHDQAECIDEGLSKAVICGQLEIGCLVKSGLFGASCLEAAVPDPTLCADVPSQEDAFALSTWLTEECSRRGHPDSSQCVQYIQQSLVAYCLVQAAD